MHLDNLVFILLIGVAALFKLLASKAGNAGKSEPPGRSTSPPLPRQPIARPPADTDEERIRRFLEALGQPTSSKPPAPVAPRTDIPPRPLAPVQPPASLPSPIPRRMLRRIVVPTQTKDKIGGHRPPLQSSVEPVFEVHQRAASAEPQPSVSAQAVVTQESIDKIDIAELLSSPSALRNAMILREIFGPPRGLQAFDFLSTS